MSEKEIKKIFVIDALDHFVSENVDGKDCIMRKVGEYVGEDDNYIFLRSKVFFWDNYEHKSDERISRILKKVIISKVEYTQSGGWKKDE